MTAEDSFNHPPFFTCYCSKLMNDIVGVALAMLLAVVPAVLLLPLDHEVFGVALELVILLDDVALDVAREEQVVLHLGQRELRCRVALDALLDLGVDVGLVLGRRADAQRHVVGLSWKSIDTKIGSRSTMTMLIRT